MSQTGFLVMKTVAFVASFVRNGRVESAGLWRVHSSGPMGRSLEDKDDVVVDVTKLEKSYATQWGGSNRKIADI